MTIEVKNTQKQNIEIPVDNTHTQELDIKQDVIIVPVYKDVPLYAGEYKVTPKVDEQTLLTAMTMLKENVIIKSIPYFDVSNNSGGNTVYIGIEV